MTKIYDANKAIISNWNIEALDDESRRSMRQAERKTSILILAHSISLAAVAISQHSISKAVKNASTLPKPQPIKN
jgi:hypothetical protein